MIVTYNWLKEFVDFDLSPQELSDLLTMIGLEVEGMSSVGHGMDDVVVAVVEEKAQHPNADKLSLCRVNTGTEILSIVCGARNFKGGDRVALARIGAVLPGDMKIKRSKIRGIESFGMLCSEKELGLADESEGIMVLDPGLPLGIPVFEALGLKDTIFEIGLTPNRADCLSVIGIAREVAAKLRKRVKYPEYRLVENGPAVDVTASVRVDDPELCPRYMARRITGCLIAPSPAWMVNRLKAVGIRPINNVVDVTNYVLLEFGHPLHAFDFSHLSGGSIIVRRASEGERFTTLDGQERVLKSSDLTIRDADGVVALAGIMGGENSEIRDTTTEILLESAYFAPAAIRRTSKRLGLRTESSHRFERGADIQVLPKALDRAASLIAELAGGKVATGVIDVYPEQVRPQTITVRQDRVSRILGIRLPAEELAGIFRSLEFSVEQIEPGLFQVTVPTWRVDIGREIDLIEEAARLKGYDKIPTTMPEIRLFSDRPSRHQRQEKRVRDLLTAHGLSEVVTYSFINPACFDLILLPDGDRRRNAVKILNPLTEEQSVMRTTLLPGLLEAAARNASFRLLNLSLFEMRRIYLPCAGQDLPDEPIYAAGIMSGARVPEGWNRKFEPVDFYDVKGVVENILDALSISQAEYKNDHLDAYFHPGKACNVYSGDVLLGSLGELHPTVQENFGFSAPLYYFELDFERLVRLSRDVTSVTSPPRFPETFRDIAMIADSDIQAGSIIECIKGSRIAEMGAVEIFDIYEGANIPPGKKSIAVRVRYLSPERTLTDEEVNRLHQRVVDNLLKRINITIR